MTITLSPGDVLYDAGEARRWVAFADVALPEKMSWTVLRAFEWCQTQWAFSQSDPRPPSYGPAALIGSGVHAVLAAIVSGWDVEWAWSRACSWQPGLDAFRDAVFAVVRDAMKWPQARAALVASVAAEVRVVGAVGGVDLVGRVDAVEEADGGVIVSDWKTGGVPDEWGMVSAMRQALIYASLLGDRFGPVVAVRLYWLGDETVTEVRLDDDSGVYAMAEAFGFVEVNAGRLESAVEVGLFETASNGRCFECPWNRSCPGSAVPTERPVLWTPT